MLTIHLDSTEHFALQEDILRMMHQIPEPLKQHIENYKDPIDRAMRLIAKLRLRQWLMARGLGKDALNFVKHTQYNKPYLQGMPDFSIAHSGGMVIFASADEGQIGVDIEFCSKENLQHAISSLPVLDQLALKQSEDFETLFYTLWTRKEAVMKATGEGVFAELDLPTYNTEKLNVHGKPYYLQRLPVKGPYVANIATTINFSTFELKLNDPIIF